MNHNSLTKRKKFSENNKKYAPLLNKLINLETIKTERAQ